MTTALTPTTATFDTVLVANRGEIACRIIRTLRRLGIRSVAVYSDADRGARHVALADVAVRLGPARAQLSYLNSEAILTAARATGAQAIHPGYGFLSENQAFAAACAAAGVVFIGPGVRALTVMGDKIRAKNHVAASGVPVIPGVSLPGQTDAQLIAAAPGIGYPMLIKPSAGGGGKGMQLVDRPEDLAAALVTARRVAAWAGIIDPSCSRSSFPRTSSRGGTSTRRWAARCVATACGRLAGSASRGSGTVNSATPDRLRPAATTRVAS